MLLAAFSNSFFCFFFSCFFCFFLDWAGLEVVSEVMGDVILEPCKGRVEFPARELDVTPADFSVGRTWPLIRVKRTRSLSGVSPLSVTVTTGSLRFDCITRRIVTICCGCDDVEVLPANPETEVCCCGTGLEPVLGIRTGLVLVGSAEMELEGEAIFIGWERPIGCCK